MRKVYSINLDLSDAAESFAKDKIVLPKALPEDNPLMKRIHNHNVPFSGDEDLGGSV